MCPCLDCLQQVFPAVLPARLPPRGSQPRSSQPLVTQHPELYTPCPSPRFSLRATEYLPRIINLDC